MSVSGCRADLNAKGTRSNGIATRRFFSRVNTLRTNQVGENVNTKNNGNFMQNYNGFNTDLEWTDSQHANGTNPIATSQQATIDESILQPQYVPKGRFYPYRNGTRQIHFEEPPSNLNRLFAESSVPGVRDIAGTRNIIRKTFWFICFLILGILALRDISQLVAEYFVYPITVNVRLKDSRRLLFPAITVCNLNIVRYSALCNSSMAVVNMTMIPPDLADKLCGSQAFTAQNPVVSVLNNLVSRNFKFKTLFNILSEIILQSFLLLFLKKFFYNFD